MGVNDKIISISVDSPDAVAKDIAGRVKARRLDLNLTQEGLAVRADIKLPSYRKFERTGEIPLRGLLKIAFALHAIPEFQDLFSQRQYQSLDDVLSEQNQKRKRGQKNE